MTYCRNCEKRTEHGSHYCSWSCRTAYHEANGPGECEHWDHRDYKFPVKIDGENSHEDIAIGYRHYPETHALIYTDGFVALAMYECCYAMWHVRTGEWLGGSLWDKTNSLAEASRANIVAWLEKRGVRG